MTELRPWAGFDSLVEGLARLQARAREAAVRSVDEILTLRNWLIGAWIVAYEQEGADRARYGEGLIDALAAAFKARGVGGLGRSNLKNYRQIALTWPTLGIRQTSGGSRLPSDIRQTLSGESGTPDQTWQTLSADSVPSLSRRIETLPWQDDAWMLRLRRDLSFSHLLELSRANDPLARAFYEVQALAHRWSVRELKRQRDSMLFERVGLSRDQKAVLALANEGRLLDTATANVRDPYVLEFLGLPERQAYSEADLEGALVDHLQEFLLELGGDFAFLGRQYRITVGGRHHFIDLLFFHRRLRCLVAVDLKIGAFGHEDAGQMNFYLNYLRENISLPDENPPVGIVLCADKDAEEVHYATGNLDHQVFVSRYLTRLPTEQQLRAWLAEERELLARGRPSKESA
ncbi:MAG TPA: PDDEXK nuclease domain-containing protein [Thermoanaerobaculia bacterium]|nr:PDDEXK nuclease domain-containing protein [Thermoanaerobaculia bacterium]